VSERFKPGAEVVEAVSIRLLLESGFNDPYSVPSA
jgi:hypothetical protein